jgi:hypothetical protein
VLLQVGTAFVTPTEGQEKDPTDGAVTVPTGFPDVPKVLDCAAEIWCVICLYFFASAAKGAPASTAVTSAAIINLVMVVLSLKLGPQIGIFPSPDGRAKECLGSPCPLAHAPRVTLIF